jgi:WD40 repeat protein
MTSGGARVAIDENNPWPGLGSFDESAERFFNGRRAESAELRRLVVHAPLTVLFGASGLGKTSLVQAGLFPQLRKDHFVPIYVRLDVRDRSAPLVEQLRAALQFQIDARGIDAVSMHPRESLWTFLHRRDLELWSAQNHLLTPVFVLDQFEEVFTLGAENSAAIDRLRVDMADLIENRVPADLAPVIARGDAASDAISLDRQRYKVLLSFREDFLPAVEGWKRDIPSLLRNRLRLLPMSGEQAFEAVHLTASHLVDEPLARGIVRFVAAAQEESATNEATHESLNDLVVEPALLSLVCHGLNEKRQAQHKSTFDAALLRGTGQAVISDYYENAVRDLPGHVQRFIENELITERGFRKPCDVDDARSIHGVTDQELAVLVNRRLLRIEPHRGTERVELTHDLLTRVVREHRNAQREADRTRRQRRRTAAFAALAAVLVALVVTFGWLYFAARSDRLIAQAARRTAEQAQHDAQTAQTEAEAQRHIAEKALADEQQAAAALTVAKNAAEQAAADATISRKEAERQAALAAGRRLATEALHRFDRTADGLAVSGALAALSMRVAPTADGRRALEQVLRLIPPAADVAPAHATPVRALAFSRDGRWAASADQAGTVFLWDTTDHMKRATIKTTYSDSTINVNPRFEGVPSGFGLALSPDGQWLAGGTMGALWLWKSATGEPQPPIPYDTLVRSVAFSPDGQRLATASRGTGVVRLFEKAGDQWNERRGLVTGGAPYKANSVAFLNDGLLALAGTYGEPPQHGVWFLDLQQMKDVFLAVGDHTANYGECRALTASQDARTLAALCGRGLFVARRDGDTFSPAETSSGDAGVFSASWGLALSRDGSYLAAADNSGVVHVFGNDGREDLWQREVSRPTRTALSIAFHPDGRHLAAGLTDGSVAMWGSIRAAASLRLPTGATVSKMAFTPNEERLVTTGDDQMVRVADISDARRARELQSWRIGPDLRRPAISPDGRWIAIPGQAAIHMLETRPLKRSVNLEVGAPVTAAAFSRDGRMLVVVSDSGIRRFQVAAFTPLMPDIAGPFRDVRQSPDGQFLATSEAARPGVRRSGELRRIWNATTGTEIERRQPLDRPSARAPQGGSRSLSNDSDNWPLIDGRTPRSQGEWAFDIGPGGTTDSTVVLKEADSGHDVARFEHDAAVVDAVFGPRGRWLATSSKDGVTRFWPLQPKDVLEEACTLLPRNLTPAEWTDLKLTGPYVKTCPNLP